VFAIFEDIGMGEILFIGIVGVLLFGKRLPEVASQAGAQLVKFRRSLQQVKAETGMDQEVRKIQRTLEEAIPRDLSVGEVARLASARVEERLRNARKELDLGLEKPPAEPAHDAGRVGPPASDSTIARVRPPEPNPQVPEGPAAPGPGEAPPQPG
jgi:Sec-independent protein translocase protein TatA